MGSHRHGGLRAAQLPPNYEAEEGCPAPGQQSRIAAVDEAWWKFWGTEDTGAEGFDAWVGPLRELPRHPPLVGLTGVMLHSAVQKWSNRKAPGADGWRPSELKQWPIGLFNLLVVFYEAVEGG